MISRENSTWKAVNKSMLGLFDSIRIGTLKLENRIVVPPMATNKATRSGEVTGKQIKHYSERSKGVGLIIVEHSYVTPEGKLSPNQLGIQASWGYAFFDRSQKNQRCANWEEINQIWYSKKTKQDNKCVYIGRYVDEIDNSS